MEQENKESNISTENTGAGDKPKAVIEPIVDDSTIKRLEEENHRLKTVLDEREKLYSRTIISGRANAGKPVKTQEELDKEVVDEKVRQNLLHAGYR